MTHANRGQSWEAVIDAMHALYEASGRASVIRNPAPMKPLGPGVRGVFRAAYIAEGPPDYSVQAGGVAYLFDAKSAVGSRWGLDNVKDHQAGRFTRHEAQGGVAFVLLRLGRRMWLLPWSRLSPPWYAWRRGVAGRGGASLTDEWLAVVGVELRSPDWLAVVRGVAP